jgi:hypothetical protein
LLCSTSPTTGAYLTASRRDASAAWAAAGAAAAAIATAASTAWNLNPSFGLRELTMKGARESSRAG